MKRLYLYSLVPLIIALFVGAAHSDNAPDQLYAKLIQDNAATNITKLDTSSIDPNNPLKFAGV